MKIHRTAAAIQIKVGRYEARVRYGAPRRWVWTGHRTLPSGRPGFSGVGPWFTWQLVVWPRN